MTRQFNVGVIGCGEQDPRAWIPTGRKLVTEGFKVVAVADPNLGKAQGFARELGIPDAYGSFAAMAERVPLHGLIVGLPADAQAAATIAGLEQGLHVFCAEPFGASAEEASRMIEAARRAGLVLGCGCWSPLESEWSLSMVCDNPLGEVLGVDVDWFRAAPVRIPAGTALWTQPGRRGDGDTPGRLLSMMLRFLGSPVTAVVATGGGSLDWCDLSLKFRCANEAVGQLFVGSPPDRLEKDRIDIAWISSGGVLKSSMAGTGVPSRGYAPQVIPLPAEPVWGPTELSIARALRSRQTNWAKACRGEAELLSRPQDAVAVHRVLGAAEDSIQQMGAWVRL